ncbi:MAG: hypothetical protein V9G98_12405 [Candidatus Competibacter sp.]
MTVPDCPPAAFRFCPGCGGTLDVREIREHPLGHLEKPDMKPAKWAKQGA